MNPDYLYEDMIRNLQWLMNDRKFLATYEHEEMSDGELDEVMYAYEDVYDTLTSLIKISRYPVGNTIKKGKKKIVEKTKLVKCINNSGYEDSFEQGIIYVLKKENDDFLIVTDMFGNDIEIFKDRFEMQK